MYKVIFTLVAILFASNAYCQCTELFISEYVEGSGNNKALEIYNPTSGSVDLSAYYIKRYRNGSVIPSDSTQLTGTLSAYSTHVIVNGQTSDTNIAGQESPACDPVLQLSANQLDGVYPSPCYFNGNDAMTLEKWDGSSFIIVDIFGKIGEDPGNAWCAQPPYTGDSCSWVTKDHTLIRKNTIEGGVLTNPSEYNPLAQWDSLPENTWSELGQHTCNCAPTSINEKNSFVSSISVYPNPINTNFFQISANSGVQMIEIVGLQGEKVFSQKLNGTKNPTIKMPENLTNGLYLIHLSFSNGQQHSQKITINK